MEEIYTVYVQVNEGACVVAVNSSAFLTYTQGWVEVDRGSGDQYHHAQSNYLTQPLYTDEGIPRYKLEGGAVVERSQEELEADLAGMVQSPPLMEQQAVLLMQSMARTATTISDDIALSIPDILTTWQEFLDSGEKIGENVCLMHDGRCYRVASSGGVTPQAHQPPGGDGMLAVYRPIDKEHAGTLDDPIPWAYGMDCVKDKYYSYEGKIYLCKQDMTPCVWAPGTEGVWQWEVVA